RSSLLGLLPGIALLFVVGYAGKFVEHFLNTWTKAHHITFPNIEYVLWAILFGIIIANTVGVARIFRPGVATYDFWLKTGIILLGARFILGDVLKLGGISLGLVFIAFAFSLTFMTWLGRTFNLNPKLTTLLAVGSSVCGVSAIIATQGAIDADEEDSSTAIAAILALGALSLFTFPLIGHTLYMSDHAYGIWAGLAVDNTAEATAAGALYSDAAGKFAVLAKTCRNALIGFVVLGYAILWVRKGLASRPATKQLDNKAAFLWQKLPKFVLGFLVIAPRHPRRLHQPTPRHTRLHQTPTPGSRQPKPLGLPPHLRRSRPTHQPQRPLQARSPPLHRRSRRRSSHSRHHPPPSPGSRSPLPPLGCPMIPGGQSPKGIVGLVTK